MVDRRTTQMTATRWRARNRMWFDMVQGSAEGELPPRATELEIPVRTGDGTESTMVVPIGKEC